MLVALARRAGPRPATGRLRAQAFRGPCYGQRVRLPGTSSPLRRSGWRRVTPPPVSPCTATRSSARRWGRPRFATGTTLPIRTAATGARDPGRVARLAGSECPPPGAVRYPDPDHAGVRRPTLGAAAPRWQPAVGNLRDTAPCGRPWTGGRRSGCSTRPRSRRCRAPRNPRRAQRQPASSRVVKLGTRAREVAGLWSPCTTTSSICRPGALRLGAYRGSWRCCSGRSAGLVPPVHAPAARLRREQVTILLRCLVCEHVDRVVDVGVARLGC